jgi:ribose transport system permease protein
MRVRRPEPGDGGASAAGPADLPADGAAPRPARPSRPGRRRVHLTGGLERWAMPLLLVALFACFSILLPGSFPTAVNIKLMLASNSVLLILAIALTLALRTGDFDLSIAANMCLSAAVVAVLTVQHHWPVGAAAVAALIIGVVIGCVNGLVVVVLRVNAFIATLGMMTCLGGLAYAVTGSTVIEDLPSSLQTFSQYDLLGIPLQVWYGWILALIALYVFEFSPAGRYVLFVGGNSQAAALSGLPVRRIRFLVFVVVGLVSAFAGVVLAGSLGAVDPSVGPAYLLPPFAAAFLGTTTVAVGRFNIVGTLVGMYLVTVGVTGLELEGAQSWVSDVFNGGVLVLAVVFSTVVSGSGRRRHSEQAA